MKLEKLEKTVQAKQEVQYVKFNEIFSIYKITTTLGDNVSYKTGLCFNTQIENLLAHPETFSPKETNGYYIFTKDTPEIFRTDVHSFHKEFSKYNMKVADLFDVIDNLENFSDYIILKYDTMNEVILEYGSELPLPKSMYFDYINGSVSNEYYNLEEMLKVLKTRNDVVVETDKRGNEIQEVPYYNQNEECNRKYISFVWQPTKEVWEKVADKMTHYRRNETVLKEVFGLKELEE